MTTLRDNFNGTGLDTRLWLALNRSCEFGTGELMCYEPAQCTVTGGNLVLTAKHLASPHACGDLFHAPVNRDYSSSMVQSNWTWRYGTIEARLKMCTGDGTFPALWFIGSNCRLTNPASQDNYGTCNWPNAGSEEVDFVEFLGANYTQINQQIHTATSNSGGLTGLGFDASAAFHTYSMEWTPGKLVFKVDGVTSRTINDVAVPATQLFMLINVSVGAAGGAPTPGDYPTSMLVDYIDVTSNELILPGNNQFLL